MQGREGERRQRELSSTFHPNLWHRLVRRLRNVGSPVMDSLGQAIAILVGQIQTRSKIKFSGEQYTQLNQSVVGYVGTSYDPLLERYVGTRVVVEVTEGDMVYEHVGILKDYTADFLEILDVHYPNQAAVQFRGEADCSEDGHICVRRDGEILNVSNTGASSLFLQRLKVGEQVIPLQAVLDKDDDLELHLPDGTAPDAEIELGVKVIRHLDWIVPRAHALIRHKAERYDPDQVFDIGFVLRLDKHTAEEEDYIKALEENPANAACAVELGQLLFRRGAIDSAERWFQHALQNRKQLADGGKLAERQLAYVRRKRGVRRPAA
jgi:tetratricopeptide (TPR) repeat protein